MTASSTVARGDSSTANSSPPMRAARSSGRRPATMRPAASDSSWSPASWPRVSLMALKSSRSRNSTTGSPPVRASCNRASTRSANRVRLGNPGQGIVIRKVAELLLEPEELRQRLLQLTVLERRACLVGEGLQQAQVVVRVARALAHAVGDDQGAHDVPFTRQGRHHHLADAPDHRPAGAAGRPRRTRVPPAADAVTPGRRSGSR